MTSHAEPADEPCLGELILAENHVVQSPKWLVASAMRLDEPETVAWGEPQALPSTDSIEL
jgi:hypothetical protein